MQNPPLQKSCINETFFYSVTIRYFRVWAIFSENRYYLIAQWCYRLHWDITELKMYLNQWYLHAKLWHRKTDTQGHWHTHDLSCKQLGEECGENMPPVLFWIALALLVTHCHFEAFRGTLGTSQTDCNVGLWSAAGCLYCYEICPTVQEITYLTMVHMVPHHAYWTCLK